MSDQKAPHYSHIVQDINSRGGLKLFFARRGDTGEGWQRHLDAVVPENGVLLHELLVINEAPHPHSHIEPFHVAVEKMASKKAAAVLPAGFYGELDDDSQLPTFHPNDLLVSTPKNAEHVTDNTVEKYREVQSIREMRAAVGSLAWLAAYMRVNAAEYTGRPVVLWGRTHSQSLPDMYERLGIHPVEVKELDSPLRYTYLKPHGLRWGDRDIQKTFSTTYADAAGMLEKEHSLTV